MPIYHFYLNNKDFRVLDFNLKAQTHPYAKLVFALLEVITDNQLSQITDKNKIIIFEDLLNCFIYAGDGTGESGECLCGHFIYYDFYILNIDDKIRYKIGSECITHWTGEKENKAEKLKQIEKLNETNGITKVASMCAFCNKNTTNNKCKSCKPKAFCKSVFSEWRTYSKNQKHMKINVVNYWVNIVKHNSKCFLFLAKKWKAYFFKIEVRKNKIKKQIVNHWVNIVNHNKNCIRYMINKWLQSSYIFLHLNYYEKDIVKYNGAIWNNDTKKWCATRYDVKHNKILKLYKPVYLRVPFPSKEYAKAKGCYWNNDTKKWYSNLKTIQNDEKLLSWIK